MKYNFIKEDITKLNMDAIVLPANMLLKEGRGASEAIFKAAGRRKLKQACEEIGFCEQGAAVPTRGFKLPATYIIHAVVPGWVDGKHYEYEMLSAAYLSALNVADIMECESIAFPLLASGNNGFSTELAMEIAVNSIESYEPKHLKNVFIVLYNDKACIEATRYGYTISMFSDLSSSENVFMKDCIKKGKHIAEEFVQDSINDALDWLSKKENRDKVVAAGIAIVGAVMKKIMEKK